MKHKRSLVLLVCACALTACTSCDASAVGAFAFSALTYGANALFEQAILGEENVPRKSRVSSESSSLRESSSSNEHSSSRESNSSNEYSSPSESSSLNGHSSPRESSLSRESSSSEEDETSSSETPHEHSYTETVVSPTCTESGYTAYACACGEAYEAARVEPLGHGFSAYRSDDNATCTEDGTETATCTREGCAQADTRTVENSKLPHIYTQSIVSQSYLRSEATCTTAASYFYTCACGAIGAESFYDGEPNDEHTVGDDGYCMACQKAVNATPGVSYSLSADGKTAAVTGYTGTSSRVVLAETYENVPVTVVSENAFSGCVALESVRIPDSVTCVERYAFRGCIRLKNAYIGKSLRSLSYLAFDGCTALQYAAYDGVQYLGDEQTPCLAAVGTTETKSVYALHESTRLIAAAAFSGLATLTEIAIPSAVTFVDDYAFENCTKLASVTFTANSALERVGKYAFFGCAALRSIALPDGVRTVDESAFYECTKLYEIVLGSDIRSIGVMAFDGCTKLRAVYYRGTAEGWNAVALGDSALPKKAVVYSYAETQPTVKGNFWRYVDGVPTTWS